MNKPRLRDTPMTEEEIRRSWQDGDPLASIAARARIRNGMTKADVRRIVFGENPC